LPNLRSRRHGALLLAERNEGGIVAGFVLLIGVGSRFISFLGCGQSNLGSDQDSVYKIHSCLPAYYMVYRCFFILKPYNTLVVSYEFYTLRAGFKPAPTDPVFIGWR